MSRPSRSLPPPPPVRRYPCSAGLRAVNSARERICLATPRALFATSRLEVASVGAIANGAVAQAAASVDSSSTLGVEANVAACSDTIATAQSHGSQAERWRLAASTLRCRWARAVELFAARVCVEAWQAQVATGSAQRWQRQLESVRRGSAFNHANWLQGGRASRRLLHRWRAQVAALRVAREARHLRVLEAGPMRHPTKVAALIAVAALRAWSAFAEDRRVVVAASKRYAAGRDTQFTRAALRSWAAEADAARTSRGVLDHLAALERAMLLGAIVLPAWRRAAAAGSQSNCIKQSIVRLQRCLERRGSLKRRTADRLLGSGCGKEMLHVAFCAWLAENAFERAVLAQLRLFADREEVGEWQSDDWDSAPVTPTLHSRMSDASPCCGWPRVSLSLDELSQRPSHAACEQEPWQEATQVDANPEEVDTVVVAAGCEGTIEAVPNHGNMLIKGDRMVQEPNAEAHHGVSQKQDELWL